MFNDVDQEEKRRYWRKQIEACPPRISFAATVRSALPQLGASLDHIEFLVIWLEHHPLVPLEEYTFGSDLLNMRRALSYEIVLRLLAHLRSFVVNINIRNRPGEATALRCILDLHALLKYLHSGNRLQDEKLLDIFLNGQSFATGADYFLNKQWMEETGNPLPPEVKKVLESWLGLPRTAVITQVAHGADAGFSALYARYSEYVHYSFAGPRLEIEEVYGKSEASAFGSKRYFADGQGEGAPFMALVSDIQTASFSLELTWPLLTDMDPFLAPDTREAVVKTLAAQGCT